MWYELSNIKKSVEEIEPWKQKSRDQMQTQKSITEMKEQNFRNVLEKQNFRSKSDVVNLENLNNRF